MTVTEIEQKKRWQSAEKQAPRIDHDTDLVLTIGMIYKPGQTSLNLNVCIYHVDWSDNSQNQWPEIHFTIRQF